MRKVNYAAIQILYRPISGRLSSYMLISAVFSGKISLPNRIYGIIMRFYLLYTFDLVPPNPKKIQALRSSGALNRHPEKVRHPLFSEHDFFDPHDMVQLKYETVRAIELDSSPIAQAALDFGLSRPAVCKIDYKIVEREITASRVLSCRMDLRGDPHTRIPSVAAV